MAGTELVLRDQRGRVQRLSASRIFEHCFRTSDPDLPPVPEAALGAPLKFAKVPLSPSLDVGFFPDSSDVGPECRVVVRGNAAATCLEVKDVSSDTPDHVVVDGVWYPFARGALDEIRDLLASVGLSRPGPMTLRQFLDLRARESETPLVSVTLVEDQEMRLHAPAVHVQVAARLYPYQQRGVGWLAALAREGLGGVLADEMGLGKTLQIIALLTAEEICLPALVVAPATLLENWRRELARFAPALETVTHHGSSRTGFPRDLQSYDVVITSYDTLVRDLSLFDMIQWGAVALDEAQAIRNPSARRTIVAKQLPRRVSIAVTGTPVENRLQDLWSLCDFAVPGYLGDLKSFLADYQDTPADASRVASIAGPFILRRRIEQVAGDLPPRIDVPQPLQLSDWLAGEYERVRQRIMDEYGTSAGFAGLVRLRQFCTHPFILLGRVGDPGVFSPKYTRLVELVEEIMEAREKVLIFTSFTPMVDILSTDLPRRLGVPVAWIDGRAPVKERQQKVDFFSALEGAAVLVLNPQAGGTGLNIAAANHVIHYNPEWNPATQDQASARAHRRGQRRPVTIHQLYFVNTIEDVMMERLQRKREIAAAALPSDADAADRADVLEALNRSPLR